ncbi:hypothetical protein CA11_26520 [Gimesia maris]|uniref:hypothetical protein n=1 Tax=Gimesia maris TaxID=122 RepID=UPI001189A024|nr:hypothetical protein [Gimesia maris]QDU14841.1 hypothetical protein CA11_26520 [Gimesia maris]
MDLYLQFGWGMMGHCEELLKKWGGGTVVLSPRDLEHDQMTKFAKKINSFQNGNVLLDSQFYLPHSNHSRLSSHSYWPESYETINFWDGEPLSTLLQSLLQLNSSLRCSKFLLPGLLAQEINDDWLTIQEKIVNEAHKLDIDLPIFLTVALSAEACKNTDQVSYLIEHSEQYPVDGYYIVCEHPMGDYLVDNPNWLANIVDLIACFRLQKKEVILGYCNQQMLVAAAAKANAICSGTWMNVRAFPPEKFAEAEENERRKTIWYYCPQALSEYKKPYLDISARTGMLSQMKAPNELNGAYADVLFQGAQPSTVDFGDKLMFRHYLYSLWGQVQQTQYPSFNETVRHLNIQLDDAEEILESFKKEGIFGDNRDFSNVINVNRSALNLLFNTQGPRLERRWNLI